MNKKLWMKIHTYLSLLLLPAALLYAITGGLFMFGINHHTGVKTTEIKIDKNIKKGKEKEIIIETLKENNIKIPDNTNIRIARNTPYIGNLAYEASLTKNRNGESVVRITERGIYSILMMMHKSAGTKHDILGLKLSFFDMIAVFFSLSMVIFYLSGLIVTSFCKKNRKTALAFFGVGFIIIALAVYGSL